ncbi:unnamed protein product [Schistosoma turkestanicum]|nr:unnamed protein product [Schistosoma turkestanicum]
MNCEASSCACDSSSKFGRPRRSNLVNSTASTSGSPSTDSRASRNFCSASCLSAGLSNSNSSLSVTAFQSASSTLSYTALALPLSRVPSTTAFAFRSLTPTSSATASNSFKKLLISPPSNSRGHGIFILCGGSDTN